MVEDTLKQRGEVYGDYAGGTELRAKIIKLVQQRHKDVTDTPMDHVHFLYIYDIINKLSRLAVTPDHKDTWLDIAGYATLVREALDD